MNLGKIYFLVAGGLCLAFVFLQAPFRVVDEQRHYIAAGVLAEGNINCSDGRARISNRKVELIAKMGLLPTDLFPKPGFNWDYVLNYSESKDNYLRSVSTIACSDPLYGHTASALGLMIGKALGINELGSFYLARLVNALFGVSLMALVIAFTPYFKRIILMIGFLPIVLLHFSSITYDSLVVPGLFLMMVTLLWVYKFGRLEMKGIVLLLPGILSIWLKPFYIPLLFVLSMMVARKQPKLTARLIVVNLAGIILILLSTHMVVGKSGVQNRDNSPFKYDYFHQANDQLTQNPLYYFDPVYQFKSLVTRPDVFVKKFAVTAILQGPSLVVEMFGYLGWEKTFLNPIIIIMFGAVGMVIVSSEKEVLVLDKFGKILLGMGIVLSIFILSVFMYMFLTATRLEFINGIQGKYFIPFILPAYLVVNRQTGVGIIIKRRLIFKWMIIVMSLLLFLLLCLDFFKWYGGK